MRQTINTDAFRESEVGLKEARKRHTEREGGERERRRNRGERERKTRLDSESDGQSGRGRLTSRKNRGSG